MNPFTGAGLITVRDSGGMHIAVPRNPPFWAVIVSNSSGVYGWYELEFAGNGTFSINLARRYGTPNYEPAYEVSGNDQVPIGAIVQMSQGFIGGNTSLSDYIKREWMFFYPGTNTPDGDTNLYAQLTNVTTSGGLLFYSFLEQVMLANGAWSNGSLTGSFNAREFNNNNITLGTYAHLFKSYDSGAYLDIQYANGTTQTVDVVATGGTFTLTFNNGTTSETTSSIAFNASTASVETALEALSNVGNCTVTGSAGDYTIEFLDGAALYPLMTYTSGLTGTTLYVFRADVGNGSTPGSITTNILVVNNETTLYGDFVYGDANLTIPVTDLTSGFWAQIIGSNLTAQGWVYDWTESDPSNVNTWTGAGRSGEINVNPAWEANSYEVDTGEHVFLHYGQLSLGSVTITGSEPDFEIVVISGGGGTYTLTVDGDTTAQIDWDATDTEVVTALEALASVGAGNVSITGSGSQADPFEVLFLITITTFTADPDGLSPVQHMVFAYERPGTGGSTTPGAPNLSLQYRSANGTVFQGLANTTANATYGVPTYGSFTALTLMGIDADKVSVPFAIGTGLSLSGSGRTLTLTAGGNGTPGGANLSLQFNNGGLFGGFGQWNATIGSNGTTILPGDMLFNSPGRGSIYSGAISVRGASGTVPSIVGFSVVASNGSLQIVSTSDVTNPWTGWSLTLQGTASPATGNGGGVEYVGANPAGGTSYLRVHPTGANTSSALQVYENGTAKYGENATTVLGLLFAGGIYIGGDFTPMAAIADADITDIVAQFNTLLAELRSAGLLAT